MNFNNIDFKSLKIRVASPEKILSWSHGEILKPETINYRTQRPEKDGLFSERIFGPTKDYECYCGKYKKIRYKGIICDKCGVEVTRSSVRRERMGHITLAAPVTHVWFLRTIPSRIGLFVNAPLQKLVKVIYYAAYIVVSVDEDRKKAFLEDVNKEFKSRKKITANSKELKDLEAGLASAKEDLKSIEVGKVLTEVEYHNLVKKFADVFEAGSGAEAIYKILQKTDIHKEAEKIEKEMELVKNSGKQKRMLYKLKTIRSFIKNGMRPEWMIMTVLPVLPPDLRPMVALDGGRFATSDLNDLYRRVINRNNRLKKLLEIKAPEVIVVNEKRMLQEAVDALIDNSPRLGAQQLSSRRRPLKSLADILKGKEGRFRQNLLGKRVDYSGRSVIVVGPDLKFGECGLPKKMALELFKPFVISKIIERGLAYNIRNANRLIDIAGPEIWEILEEVIQNKKVLLNRAPTLHRLGIQAFQPVLIEDLAIRIPPMVCDAFNADFDGDQMAVHLPLSEEAQKEAAERMSAIHNILKPATGDPIAQPTKDITLGCYYLTKLKNNKDNKDNGENIKSFSSPEEAVIAYNFGYIQINEPAKIRWINDEIIETSVGRVIFNLALPEDFGFVNKLMNKKELGKLVAAFIDKYGIGKMWEILDKIRMVGFTYATLSGITWGMDDLIIPSEKKQIIIEAEKEENLIKEQYNEGLLTDFERHVRVVNIWDRVKDQISGIMPKVLDPFNSVFQIIDSGARGSWSPLTQMMGMKGLVQNPQGETIELPVKSSYKEGLSVLEFFINTHGARKGLTDTALKTASAGYLTRRLVDVSQDLIIRENDCKTTKGIETNRSEGDDYGYPLGQRGFGRTALEDIKVGGKILVKAGEIIDRQTAQLITDSKIESIKIRSPITCKTLYGICSKCYGFDLAELKPIQIGEAVGVVAAQSIGEPGTQLTLRTFHTGGVAGVDITHGLERVQELFETRVPKGKAYLAEADGVIEDIEERKLLKVIQLKVLKVSAKGKSVSKVVEYPVSRATTIFVKPHDKVSKGDQLCEGSLDLQELFQLRGAEATERYIINEIQKIYVSEGSGISDKHLEIIVRQMFSRVMISDSGDTDFVLGEILEKSKFLEVNRQMKEKNKQPARAKQLLMGITKVALSTESFLSAASFQETARVLVSAASEGREDRLRGLKENVIIGKLIPTGTGYKKEGEDSQTID